MTHMATISRTRLAMSWWVCHAKSIGSVGTKKEPGAEDMRSRNLPTIKFRKNRSE